MMTMTNGKNPDSRTKPFENGNGKEELKKESKKDTVMLPIICGWYVDFKEKPGSMNREAMESFIKQYGCRECNGYKTPCGGRA